MASLAKRLNEAAPKLDTALTDFGTVVKAVDPVKISRTVDNVERFTTSLNAVDSSRVARIVENVDSFTQSLGDNKQNVVQHPSGHRDPDAAAQRHRRRSSTRP